MKINESESSRRYPERAVVDTNVIVNVALGKDDTTDPSFLTRSERLLNDGIAGELELLLPSMVMIELSCNFVIRSGQSGQTRSRARDHKQRLIKWCYDCRSDGRRRWLVQRNTGGSEPPAGRRGDSCQREVRPRHPCLHLGRQIHPHGAAGPRARPDRYHRMQPAYAPAHSRRTGTGRKLTDA